MSLRLRDTLSAAGSGRRSRQGPSRLPSVPWAAAGKGRGMAVPGRPLVSSGSGSPRGNMPLRGR